MGLENILFIVAFTAAVFLFSKNLKAIIRNIKLGKDLDISDNKLERWKKMILVAIGQSKMVVKPVSGLMHIIVYAGFIIINIEVLEIIIDGIFGTHRVFAAPLGGLYDFLIGSFEILALLVLVACVVFFIRRNAMTIKRFKMKEMLGWPKTDANIILIVEVFLMGAFLKMNAADQVLQARGVEHYVVAGSYPVSQFLVPIMENFSSGYIIFLERATWWFHIL